MKKTGTKKIARMVTLTMPPTTAVPIAMRLAAPAPEAMASGKVPNTKAIEVIRIGRSRTRHAVITASRTAIPSSKR